MTQKEVIKATGLDNMGDCFLSNHRKDTAFTETVQASLCWLVNVSQFCSEVAASKRRKSKYYSLCPLSP